ncbi:hypothetical protein HID58_070982, partial [Brassica napus]
DHHGCKQPESALQSAKSESQGAKESRNFGVKKTTRFCSFGEYELCQGRMIITPTGQRNPFLHSWSCFPGLVMLSTSKLQTDKDLHLNGMAGQAKSKERKRLSAMVLQICVDMTVRVTVRALLFPSESHAYISVWKATDGESDPSDTIYLLSSSLDGTIKVWAASENGILKVKYTRRREQVRVRMVTAVLID